MSGDRFSKQFKQTGQVLLIIVMIIAVVTTVALTVLFKSQTETKITRLQSENTRVQEAAQAAIEVGFSLPETNANLRLDDPLVNLTNLIGIDSAKSQLFVSTGSPGSEFLTPEVGPNEMYTFYLSYVDSVDPLRFINDPHPFQGSNLNIYFGASVQQCSQIALEITMINSLINTDGNITNAYIRSRYIADVGNILRYNIGDIGQRVGGGYRYDLTGDIFYCSATIQQWDIDNHPLNNFPRILLVRLVTSQNITSRLLFRAANGTSQLPPQGRVVRSEVYSSTGVLSIYEATQSYPQLPASFFVTSF